ncbi:hypothetical protein D3C86_2160560 [compost metagenome]
MYGPTGLVEYKTQEVVVNKYDNQALSVTLTVPAVPAGYSIKAFIWDNANDMTALADAVTLQ